MYAGNTELRRIIEAGEIVAYIVMGICIAVFSFIFAGFIA